MAVETKALAIPEAGARHKELERQKTQAVASIDRKLVGAIKRGRFAKVQDDVSFESVRSVVDTDRALAESLEPDIGTIFMVLQDESERMHSGERIPGSTAITQMASMELLRGIAGAPDKARKRKELLESVIRMRKPVTVVLGRLSREGPYTDRIAEPSLVIENREQILASIIDSARFATEVGKSTGMSEILRSLTKKETRTLLSSGFEPWFKFAADYLSRLAGTENGGIRYTHMEGRILTEVHSVVMEKLLLKLMDSLFRNPGLIIIRPDPVSITDTRVQVLNLLGQGVEINHILVDPRYFTDPANEVFRGTEFVGLVDTAAFVNVPDRVQRIVSDPNRDIGLYVRLVSSLLQAGLLVPGRFGRTDAFTGRTLDAIIAGASGTPCYEQVVTLLHSSQLITSPARRQLMLQSGGK